ncbi:Transcriptional regulator of nonfermentable carbon utilization, partial [Irineochytrium annulatum]
MVVADPSSLLFFHQHPDRLRLNLAGLDTAGSTTIAADAKMGLHSPSATSMNVDDLLFADFTFETNNLYQPDDNLGGPLTAASTSSVLGNPLDHQQHTAFSTVTRDNGAFSPITSPGSDAPATQAAVESDQARAVQMAIAAQWFAMHQQQGTNPGTFILDASKTNQDPFGDLTDLGIPTNFFADAFAAPTSTTSAIVAGASEPLSLPSPSTAASDYEDAVSLPPKPLRRAKRPSSSLSTRAAAAPISTVAAKPPRRGRKPKPPPSPTPSSPARPSSSTSSRREPPLQSSTPPTRGALFIPVNASPASKPAALATHSSITSNTEPSSHLPLARRVAIEAPTTDAPAYARLLSSARTRLGKWDQARLLFALATLRPALLASQARRSPADEVLAELTLRRSVADVERTCREALGTPCCVWRGCGGGEIVWAGEEFAELCGWASDALAGEEGKKGMLITDVMDAAGMVEYWEGFAGICTGAGGRGGVTGGDVLTGRCTLVRPDGLPVPCAYWMTVKRD